MKERSAYFDNAKLILIFLVILGHLIEKLAPNILTGKYIYTFLYFFHMPALVLLSGYFSKKLSAIPKRIIKYIIYYLLFEVAYYFIFKGNYPFMTTPYWLLWYLVSLVSWNAMLPIFSKSKWLILIVIAISIIAGYIDNIGYAFSLSRTLVFFPFFLVGYFLTELHFDKLNSSRIKITAMIILAFALAACFFIKISIAWLYGSVGYEAIGFKHWYAGIFRLVVFAASGLLCFSFFALIPRKSFLFSFMGAYTLDAYLLHGFIVLWLEGSSLFENMGKLSQTLAVLGLSITITFVLLNIRWSIKAFLSKFSKSSEAAEKDVPTRRY